MEPFGKAPVQSYNVRTKRCNLCLNEKFRVAEEVRRKGGIPDTEINICLHVAILKTTWRQQKTIIL